MSAEADTILATIENLQETSQVTTIVDHWIGGKTVPPASGEYFEDLNPLDDSIFARVAKGNADDVRHAIETAQSAFQTYRRSTPTERESWLLAAASLLQERSNEFIDLLIDEIGSPILKAEREIATATGTLRAAAGACRRLTGKTIPSDIPGRISMSVRQPLGVIAGITPFNVPLIKAIKHSAMPLATGNTFVLLPSEETPVLASRVARLYSDAGFPEGAFNLVTGHGTEIGDVLTTHPLVKMVGFTGSTRVGRHVAELCGRLGKRVTLEMGGKNPLIILKDADLDRAVLASVIGSFTYQGQICMSSSRIYVEQPLYDAFVQRFAKAAAGLGMEDLRDRSTMIGPIINDRQRARVKRHLDDAIAKGAVAQTGAQWTDNRCAPTVLTDIPEDALIRREETFGPVTAVYPVDSPEDALKEANSSEFGLCAAVFTANLNLATRFAEQLNAGMVHVNSTTIQEEALVPFGGVGDSGFGRESTDTDIAETTEWKWITLGPG